MTGLQPLIDWIAAHPHGAWAVIFASAALDSLFVVGVFLPGAVIMFSVGALIALGALDFWTCIAVVTLGAFTGDTVTYWIGRHFRDRLFRLRVIRSRPELIERGRRFFERHGGKSVVLGRFIGPMRPVVPAFSGVYGMSIQMFVAADLIACIGWTFLYVVPGVAFGASLSLAAEVTTRLVVLVVALLVLVFLLSWIVRRAVLTVQGHAGGWVHALLDWSHRHRRVGRLGAWLADPEQPETPGLAVLAILLLSLSALWLWLWWGVGASHPAPFDAVAYQTLRDLHTPAGLALAAAVAQLGEWPVYVPVTVAMLVVLLVARRFRAASHWVAAVGFGTVIAIGLTLLLELPDPLRYFRGNHSVRFSGRELVLATVVYGFMPVILATGRGAGQRSAFYILSVTLISLIALAQMYIGAQWLSIAAFAIVIGTVWVSLLGLGYRRHGAQPVPARTILLPVACTFALAAGLHWSQSFQSRLEALEQAVPHYRQPADAWWTGGFRELPAYRVDVAGLPRQPLNVQWAGHLDRIRESLQQQGWEVPRRLSPGSMLRWLAQLPIGDLPVLPQVHAGRNQELMLRYPIDDSHQWLLRLWPSEWTVGRDPLWIGNVTQQFSRGLLGMLRYPATLSDYSEPMRALAAPPPGFDVRRVIRANPETRVLWKGEVLLLRPATDRRDG